MLNSFWFYLINFGLSVELYFFIHFCLSENENANANREDAQNELMGAEASALVPGLQYGGMTVDTAVFLQSALNMTDVDKQSDGVSTPFRFCQT